MAAVSPEFLKPLGISGGAVQTPGKKGAQPLHHGTQGKKRPALTHSSEEEEVEEEDSEEDGVLNQEDLWGSEDSDADMIDDYGADSDSEGEDEDEEVSFSSVGFEEGILAF